MDDAHAAPAATGNCLDDQRVADLPCDVVGFVERLDRLDGAGEERQPRRRHQLTRRCLVADLLHDVGSRADERDSFVRADLSEVRVLGQEPVAGMDRVGTRLERCADDARDVQIAPTYCGRTDLNRLVGKRDDRGLRVGGREHRHAVDAELATRTGDAQGDLTAVRDQDLLEHRYSAGSRYMSTCSNSTHAPSSATISLIFPPWSAWTWFISFIASTMATV